MKPASENCPHCGGSAATQNAPHQLPIGTVLKEQYQIGRVLGQGGFGITYLGWDIYLDIPVAIKEYYPSGMVMRESSSTMSVFDVSGGDGERFRNNRERFMREAKLLARFSDVHEVVQVKNFFLTNNTAYIVMEFVEGITLTEYVQNHGGKLTPKETFDILGPIIQTMARVHKIGIIHRDIKPNNIMMVGGGAKVLDFGAGRDVTGSITGDDPSKSTEAIVSHGYSAFEQYQRRGLGTWTDVYALCATMYYCMTGEVPPDSLGRLMGEEELDLDKIPGLTPKQKSALYHGMEMQRNNRTATMEKLYEELFIEQVCPEPQPPVPEPPKPEPPKPEPPKPEPPRPEPPKPEPPSRISSKTIVSQMVSEEENSLSKKKIVPGKKKNGFSALIVGAVAVVLVVLIGAVIYGITDRNPLPKAEVTEAVQENIISGDCGTAAWWKLDLDTGVMEITGTMMADFYLEEYSEEMRRYKRVRPWEEYVDEIREVYFVDKFLYRVGTAAFAHCKNLHTVHFNEELREIGGDAFWDTALTEIDLPQTMITIEWGAFENTNLRKVTIPDNVRNVGDMAFFNCSNLEEVYINREFALDFNMARQNPLFSRNEKDVGGITVHGPSGGILEDYAGIYGYNYVHNGYNTRFEIQGDFSEFPGNVNGRWYLDRDIGYLKIEGEMPREMVAKWEFEDKNYHMPAYRKQLPGVPWETEANDIRVVYVAEGVTTIGENAFFGLYNVTDVYLPSTLENICTQSFVGTNIEELYLPDSVSSIENYAFNHCENLRVVKLPENLKELNQNVFCMCVSLEALYASDSTKFDYEEREGFYITPFNQDYIDEKTKLDERQLPANLTIYTPEGTVNGKPSSARSFAEKVGISYEQGEFQP